jgi:hypothetical protein
MLAGKQKSGLNSGMKLVSGYKIIISIKCQNDI